MSDVRCAQQMCFVWHACLLALLRLMVGCRAADDTRLLPTCQLLAIRASVVDRHSFTHLLPNFRLKVFRRGANWEELVLTCGNVLLAEAL